MTGQHVSCTQSRRCVLTGHGYVLANSPTSVSIESETDARGRPRIVVCCRRSVLYGLVKHVKQLVNTYARHAPHILAVRPPILLSHAARYPYNLKYMPAKVPGRSQSDGAKCWSECNRRPRCGMPCSHKDQVMGCARCFANVRLDSPIGKMEVDESGLCCIAEGGWSGLWKRGIVGSP